jgi:amino acid transporter
MSLKDQLFARKSLQVLLDEMAGEHRLKRALGPVTLTALGIGAVIGAGIFVATGAAARDVAGPALMLSYVVAGITCIFAALCYAEFASMAPVAGSAYTYAYTTLGELFAWIIGWDLVLEYAVGAATVANGWSGYFQSVLGKVGLAVPIMFSGAPEKYDKGHLLPNVKANYAIEVRQKELDTDKADWIDAGQKKAHGTFWVYSYVDREGNENKQKEVVLGKVGDPAVEKKIQNDRYSFGVEQAAVEKKDKLVAWATGDPQPADGIYWVFKVKEKGDEKNLVVGKVGDEAVEKKIVNREQAVINLPAIIIVALVTLILIKGISESAGANAVMVAIKVAAVLFVIVVGAFFINPDNWSRNFAPYGWAGVSFFGHHIPGLGQTNAEGDPVGVLAGAAIIFFAYIGFDSVSTHAEEAKNPRRDVPIGIICSLVICTVLYIGVVAVITGMVPFDQITKDAGVADAFDARGLGWAQVIIGIAGVAGITSVLLVMLLSAPRVFLAMARDGLVPRSFFADVHPRFRTPWKSTIAIGIFVALLTGFLPIDALLHLTNIGTLFAFAIVCGAVLIMRRTDPGAPRPFRCPFVPVVPVLGIASCLLLMLSLPEANWYRLLAWLALGLCIYFLYGRHHSILGQELRGEIGKHGVSPAGMIDGGPKV